MGRNLGIRKAAAGLAPARKAFSGKVATGFP
jgi:hypothetical protein